MPVKARLTIYRASCEHPLCTRESETVTRSLRVVELRKVSGHRKSGEYFWAVDFAQVGENYGVNGPEYFRGELERLSTYFNKDGLVKVANDVVEVTAHGRFLIRSLCKVFDNFVGKDPRQYKISQYNISNTRSRAPESAQQA